MVLGLYFSIVYIIRILIFRQLVHNISSYVLNTNKCAYTSLKSCWSVGFVLECFSTDWASFQVIYRVLSNERRYREKLTRVKIFVKCLVWICYMVFIIGIKVIVLRSSSGKHFFRLKLKSSVFLSFSKVQYLYKKNSTIEMCFVWRILVKVMIFLYWAFHE